METRIKKYGNSAVIVLPSEFLKIKKLKIGDGVEVNIKKMSKK